MHYAIGFELTQLVLIAFFLGGMKATLRLPTNLPLKAAWVDNGLSASSDPNGQAAARGRYFSGRNSSATASCSGTSGKKLSRWQ